MTGEKIAAARTAYLALLKDPRTTAAQLQERVDEIAKNEPGLLCALEPESDRELLNSNTPVSKQSETYYKNLGKLEKYNFSRERIEYLIRVREFLKNNRVSGFAPQEPPQNRENTSGMMENYTPSDNLRKFVHEGDLPTIRTALRMELNDNSLTSSDLEAAMAWARSQIHGLFEPLVDKSFARGMENNQKLWTSQYYDSQTVYLKTNFSAERFHHLIQVRSLLRQQGVKGFASLPPVAPGSNSSLHTTVHVRPRISQTDNRRDTEAAGHTANKQQSSSGCGNQLLRTILIIGCIGCSFAAAVMVVTLLLTNRNDQPTQQDAPYQAWQADTSAPVDQTSGHSVDDNQ